MFERGTESFSLNFSIAPFMWPTKKVQPVSDKSLAFRKRQTNKKSHNEIHNVHGTVLLFSKFSNDDNTECNQNPIRKLDAVD